MYILKSTIQFLNFILKESGEIIGQINRIVKTWELFHTLGRRKLVNNTEQILLVALRYFTTMLVRFSIDNKVSVYDTLFFV